LSLLLAHTLLALSLLADTRQFLLIADTYLFPFLAHLVGSRLLKNIN
jgi:hypothetical protein